MRASCRAADIAPAPCPAKVTFVGSPPKAKMLRRIHSRDFLWKEKQKNEQIACFQGQSIHFVFFLRTQFSRLLQFRETTDARENRNKPVTTKFQDHCSHVPGLESLRFPEPLRRPERRTRGCPTCIGRSPGSPLPRQRSRVRRMLQTSFRIPLERPIPR